MKIPSQTGHPGNLNPVMPLLSVLLSLSRNSCESLSLPDTADSALLLPGLDFPVVADDILHNAAADPVFLPFPAVLPESVQSFCHILPSDD